MIMLAKFADPAEVLKKLEEKELLEYSNKSFILPNEMQFRAAGLESRAALFLKLIAKAKLGGIPSNRPIKGENHYGKQEKNVLSSPWAAMPGQYLPEQMKAVKITAKAIVDPDRGRLRGYRSPWQRPLRLGMINNAMAALSREDANQPNTLSPSVLP